MWFPYVCILVLTFRFSSVHSQSVDEEEAVHMVEGSGNFASDDEDIEGSSLPPDAQYATTPIVHPRFTQSTTAQRRLDSTVKYTTVIRPQRITTFATSTPSGITKPKPNDAAVDAGTFSASSALMILGLLVFLLTAIVIAVVCFTCCNRTKVYRPGEHRRSEALLNSPQSR